MSRDTESQSPQQSETEDSKAQNSCPPDVTSNGKATAAATATTTEPKKGRALLYVPSRSSSQKNLPSLTPTGLSGATASESRDSIGRHSRESKTSSLGVEQHHPNGSVSSKHSSNINSPPTTSVNPQPSSPVVASRAHPKPQRKKGGSGGFLALFGCCAAPSDANSLDDDAGSPLPTNKLKDLPPRPVTASRKIGASHDGVSPVAGTGTGTETRSSLPQIPSQQLNEKKEKFQDVKSSEPLPQTLQTRQHQPQHKPSANSDVLAEAAGTAIGAAPTSKEKQISDLATRQDQSTYTASPAAAADTSSEHSDADPEGATQTSAGAVPTVTFDAPIKQASDDKHAKSTEQDPSFDDVETQGTASENLATTDNGTATASKSYDTRSTPDVLPSIPPPPPGLPPTSVQPTSENDNTIAIAELVEVHRQKALLPPIEAHLKGRKCLVLDLDETLVHSSFKILHQADFTIPVEIEGNYHNIYVIKRPGVDQFMKRVGELYEVVVFTASVSKYGNPLLDQLDIHNVVHHRLFRESCFNHQGNYVKDLSMVGRDLKETIIIDNSPTSYIFHPQHAVPISSWFSDAHDNELLDLIPVLEDLAGPTVQDVSMVLDVTL
ncbi:hypothetical protein SEPCBS119000_005414 [Sporothrix epigloea]|uniref:FCP1 homology domain-containing protein n=1 Tax=Sporothrix epigloea TaxID=1892477 RepID=A0ABP0E175_9PEZI